MNWWQRKKPLNTLLGDLAYAHSYEQWESIVFQLDELLHTDLWRQNATSKYYDFRLIHDRRKAIISAQEDGDVLGLVNLLRSGLVRNLGNITTPKLFNRAYAGTKLLIEEYITQVALAIEHVTALPTAQSHKSGWTSQAKLDLLHDTRQAFGRSALVLQGGAVFGLCHLGVVKALHLRGLLPRIITGTATGALVAALVCIHTEDELLEVLGDSAIDLATFGNDLAPAKEEQQWPKVDGLPWPIQTLLIRALCFIRDGRFLHVTSLEESVRTKVGELTFEEAYARTTRVLNITIPTSGRGGVPNLLNYLTAPNVLIWSAASASNTSTSLNQPLTLLCKDETGAITPWSKSYAQSLTFQPQHISTHTFNERDSPLSRTAELFNVNHFIVSQARPYIAPFLRSDLQHPSSPRQSRRTGFTLTLLRLATQEIHHRLNQLDALGLLPVTARRLLIDETVPGASLTLVPYLRPTDLWRLLDAPSRENLEYWILQGERSVWPNVCSLRIRCAVEVELDRCYQLVRRRKPLDAMGGGAEMARRHSSGSGAARKRMRASSVGQG